MVLPVLTGAFVLSLLAALVFVPLVRDGARRLRWTDQPDGERKLHARPTPTVGGVALVAAFAVGVNGMQLLAPLFGAEHLVSVLAPPWAVMLGAGLVAALGLLDDLLDLGYRTKLAGQAAAAALVWLSGLRVTLFDGVLGDGVAGLVVSAVLTVAWVVTVANAVNLVDGRDGLAGGLVVLAFAGLAGAHVIRSGDTGGLLLVAAALGALLGFLRYNAPPASIFMGDSGSLFLGYLLAAYALRGTAHPQPALALAVPAVALGLPLLDALVTVARRLVHRRPLFRPDRDHIHHRVAARLSERAAGLLLGGIGLALALAAVAIAASPVPVAVGVLAGVGVGAGALLYWLGYLRRTPGGPAVPDAPPSDAARIAERAGA